MLGMPPAARMAGPVSAPTRGGNSMTRRSSRALAALSATLLMTLAVADVSANRLSVTNARFRIVWRSIEFRNAGFPGEARCPVTLEGSFHSSTMSKVADALIGHISRASVASASCTGGSATILQESLPWHVAYKGFRGTLPEITSVRLGLIGVWIVIRINSTLSLCLVRSTSASPVLGEAGVEIGGNFGVFRTQELTQIPEIAPNGAGECPTANARFESPANDGAITLLGTTTKIRLRLI
jgi:hypothetical protein